MGFWNHAGRTRKDKRDRPFRSCHVYHGMCHVCICSQCTTDYTCVGIFERTIAVRIAETELCYVCIRFCCMPTMIVRDSMTVVFPKVEVPTITCVGFLKNHAGRKRNDMRDWPSRSSVVSILSWCTTDYDCVGIVEKTIIVRIVETDLYYVCIRFTDQDTSICVWTVLGVKRGSDDNWLLILFGRAMLQLTCVL